MAYTPEQLVEISTIAACITQLSGALSVEGQVDPADRLLGAGNVTAINDNVTDLSAYLATLVPPA